MFFDLTKCVQVVTVGELISGEVSASTLFTCPTPQVKKSTMYMLLHVGMCVIVVRCYLGN